MGWDKSVNEIASQFSGLAVKTLDVVQSQIRSGAPKLNTGKSGSSLARGREVYARARRNSEWRLHHGGLEGFREAACASGGLHSPLLSRDDGGHLRAVRRICQSHGTRSGRRLGLGSRRPPGDQRQLVGCRGLRPMAGRDHRHDMPAAERGGVGIRLPGWYHERVCAAAAEWQRRHRRQGARELRALRQRVG
jgi:hypothetical protein